MTQTGALKANKKFYYRAKQVRFIVYCFTLFVIQFLQQLHEY